MTEFKRRQYAQWVREQVQWIHDHGDNLAGYVMRYGSRDDPKHFGDGGEAIYTADLNFLIKQLHRLNDPQLMVHLDMLLEDKLTGVSALWLPGTYLFDRHMFF